MALSFFGHHFTGSSLDELKLIFAGIQKDFFSNSCHQKSGHVVLYPFLEIAQRFFLSVVVSTEFSFDLTPSKSVDRT